MKSFGEIISAHGFETMPFTATACLLSSIIGAGFSLFMLNLNMRYYNNIDVMPIYQSFLLLMMLATGWVVLDEVHNYSVK